MNLNRPRRDRYAHETSSTVWYRVILVVTTQQHLPTGRGVQPSLSAVVWGIFEGRRVCVVEWVPLLVL
jgi:hypothetical protein